MKEEIRRLFPLEFYINENGKMRSEISLENLNKIIEEIERLNNIINKAIEYLNENEECYEDSYYKRNELLETKELIEILKEGKK